MNELARPRNREFFCPQCDCAMVSADQRISNNGSFCNDRMLRVISAGAGHCKKTSEVRCYTELRKSATAITADNRREFRSLNSQLTHPNFSRQLMRCQLANCPLPLSGNAHKHLLFKSLYVFQQQESSARSLAGEERIGLRCHFGSVANE